MVGLFVRLKLTLMRNGLRGGWQRRMGLIMGAVAAATLLGLSGAVIGYTTSPASLVVVAAAIVVEVALCLTASRAVITALSRMLRSRRGRDVSVILVALVALLPQLLRLALPAPN